MAIRSRPAITFTVIRLTQLAAVAIAALFLSRIFPAHEYALYTRASLISALPAAVRFMGQEMLVYRGRLTTRSLARRTLALQIVEAPIVAAIGLMAVPLRESPAIGFSFLSSAATLVFLAKTTHMQQDGRSTTRATLILGNAITVQGAVIALAIAGHSVTEALGVSALVAAVWCAVPLSVPKRHQSSDLTMREQWHATLSLGVGGFLYSAPTFILGSIIAARLTDAAASQARFVVITFSAMIAIVIAVNFEYFRPQLVSAADENLRSRTRRLWIANGMLAIGGVAASLLAALLVQLWAGPSVKPAAAAIALLAVTSPVLVMTQVYLTLDVSRGDYRGILARTVPSTLLTFSALVLPPTAIGSALTLVIAEVGGLAAMMFFRLIVRRDVGARTASGPAGRRTYRTVGILTGAVPGIVTAVGACVLIALEVSPAPAAAAVVGLALLLVLVLRWPWTGVAILMVYLPANNLLTQLIGSGSAAATGLGAIKDVVLAALLLLALTRSSRIRKEITGPVLALFVVALISFDYASGFSAGLYGFRNDYEPVLLLIAVPAVLTVTEARRLLGLFAWATEISAALAIYTWSLGAHWLYTLHILPPTDPSQFPFQFFSAYNNTPRAFSPAVAPNELGVYLDIGLAVILTRDSRLRTRLALVVIPVIALVLTRSRSAELGAVALIAVLLIRATARKNRRAAYGLGTLFGLGALGGLFALTGIRGGLASGNYDSSVVGHAASVQSGLVDAISHPLGYGLGNVGPRAVRYIPNPILVESYWLLIALEIGVIGLLLYGFLLVRVARLLVRLDLFGVVGLAALAASSVSQFVLPTMQDGTVSFSLWIVVGIGCISANSSGDMPVEAASQTEENERRRVLLLSTA